jgi:flagellar hook-associated protein 3 FlgL
MRVTDLTKQNAVLRNIQTNSDRLQTLQENMSSGRRINKLSDDPIGATQVQDFRTKLSFLGMLKHNIQQNYIWLDRSEGELEHMADALRQAKTLVLAQANDSSDQASRNVTAEELDAITESLFKSGNAKIGKVYIFAGSRTLTQPLEKREAVHPALVNGENIKADLKFLVDLGRFKADFDGFSSRPYIVRVDKEGPMGRALYSVSDDGGKSWSKPKTLLPDIEVFNPDGEPSEKLMLHLHGSQLDKLGDQVVYPEGLEFTFDPNPPVSYMGNDDRRLVPLGEDRLEPLNLTAREILYKAQDKPDTVDIFELLSSLSRSLRDNDPRVLEKRLGDLDRAYNQVLSFRADVGSVRRELEDQLQQIGDREFSDTKQLSQIEDLDFPSAVVEMNMADVRNKASLDTSSRLIQPSLLNFLK